MTEMTPTEKLAMIEALWEELTSSPAEIPVHEWQKEELARRKERLKANPESGLTWEDVERHVRDRHGK